MKKSVNTITKTMKQIFRLPYLLHELCHYIPAYWMGLNPEIPPEWNRIRFDWTTPARWIIVGLFPAFCASIILMLVLTFTWRQLLSLDLAIRIPASLNFVVWAYWLNLSYGDFLSVIHFCRTGERKSGKELV